MKRVKADCHCFCFSLRPVLFTRWCQLFFVFLLRCLGILNDIKYTFLTVKCLFDLIWNLSFILLGDELLITAFTKQLTHCWFSFNKFGFEKQTLTSFVYQVLKDPSQPPPFSTTSKLLIQHDEANPYCFTVSCVPGGMFNYLEQFYSDFSSFRQAPNKI